ncbi:unnamed protein product, partial [Discosporangium mesarthrocarpum]
LEKAQLNRARERGAASKGQMPNFALRDFMIVARVFKRGSEPKLVIIWTGPWRVVAETPDVYQVQNIISGEGHNMHISRLEQEVSSDLKKTFQYT